MSKAITSQRIKFGKLFDKSNLGPIDSSMLFLTNSIKLSANEQLLTAIEYFWKEEIQTLQIAKAATDYTKAIFVEFLVETQKEILQIDMHCCIY